MVIIWKKKFVLIVITITFIIGIYYIKSNNIDKDNGDISVGDTISGDVNGNGKVNATDYVAIRKYLLKTGSLTDNQKKRADVNSDGKVSSADYVVIRKILLNGGASSGTTYKDLLVINSKYSYTVSNYNVVDYGADPTGTKDSTEAFQKALENASNCVKNSSKKCGGVVYAPKGKYVITKPLHLCPYVGLIGDLEEGTANGTILMIKHCMHSTDNSGSAITMDVFSSIQNMAFWYPDQAIKVVAHHNG